MFTSNKAIPWTTPLWLLGVLAIGVTTGVTFIAPEDVSMGESQRILYLHVSVAWTGLLAFVLMALFGGLYLRRRNLSWDAWAQGAAEIGWLNCTLTLMTGSMWGHVAWGTWWTWDPRLTTFLILWMILTGILYVRRSLPHVHQRARTCAVLAAIGLLDIPLVTMATRWFRGIHPVSPEMEPAMRYVLAASVAAFTAFFLYLLVQRARQLQWQSELTELRFQAGEVTAWALESVSRESDSQEPAPAPLPDVLTKILT